MHITSCALLLPLGLSATAAAAKRNPSPPSKNAVLLSDVQTLTLRGAGAKTTHRRARAIPQLQCVSPRAICDLHAVDVMRCTNQGSSYGDEDVEWSCAASLPPELKLGSTDVICEGYASAEDPYVLKGSCGVEYTLALTQQGERRYPELARGGGGDRWFSDGKGGTDVSAWAFALVFVGVFAWIVYSACVAGSDNNSRRRENTTRRYGGGGGGGGGGDGGGGPGGGWGPRNDPPPPYPGSDSNYKPSSSSSSSSQQQGWRPGFWTGLAGGAAASYLAGGRNRDNRNNYPPWGADNYGSGSRWSGGNSWAGPSSSSSSRTSGSGSGERHESTGFGSTRRR